MATNSRLPKSKVFIGSCVKGVEIARAVEQNLSHQAETYIWTHTFPPGKTTLEALVDSVEAFDFAVLM